MTGEPRNAAPVLGRRPPATVTAPRPGAGGGLPVRVPRRASRNARPPALPDQPARRPGSARPRRRPDRRRPGGPRGAGSRRGPAPPPGRTAAASSRWPRTGWRTPPAHGPRPSRGDRVDLHVADPARGPRHVLRVIRELMLRAYEDAGAVVFHAAGVDVDGGTVMICGPRGAGKTTAAAALLHQFGPRARLLSNDRLLACDGHQVVAVPLPVPVARGTLDAFPALQGRRARRPAGDGPASPPWPPCRASSGPPARSPSPPGTSPPRSGPGWRPAAR